MKLRINTGEDVRTVERVEYFEVGHDTVHVERDGARETIDGQLYAGEDI